MSEDTDLPEETDLVVEQVSLHDLTVPPVCNRTELQLKRLSSRVVNFAVETLPRADHLALPVGDSAGPITGPEHHAVWIVFEVTRHWLLERMSAQQDDDSLALAWRFESLVCDCDLSSSPTDSGC